MARCWEESHIHRELEELISMAHHQEEAHLQQGLQAASSPWHTIEKGLVSIVCR
jgi:hypothetical protein